MSSGIEPHGSTTENVDDTVRRLVVERSHDLVVLCDLRGAIVYASPSWLALGWDPHDLTGVALQDLIHPDDLGVAAAAGEQLNAGSNVDAVTVRLRGPDGSYTWFEINGSQVLGEDGELRFILGTARDVSAQQELHESREQLATILRTVDEGITVADTTGRLLYANDASARQFGKESVEELLAAPREEWLERFELLEADGEPLALDSLPSRRAYAGEEGSKIILRRDRETGEERWLDVGANPAFGPDGSVEIVVNVSRDITAERLAEQRRVRSEEQVRFLARASELLVASLDWEETVAAIATLAVPELAGYLVVDLLDDGVLHNVVAAHADPELTELVYKLRGQYPPTVPSHPIQVAIRTGETQLIPDLQAEVDAMAHDAKHARDIRRIANTSGIVAPLIARGRTLGSISLGTVEPQRRFDESDREMATELARRISLALDNARLYAAAQERAHAAEALEHVADGVFLVDELGIVRLWNPTAALSLRRSASDAVGRPIAELLADWASLSSRIPVTSGPDASATRPETLPVEVDGQERWLSISAVRFPRGTVYAFRDVTDERAVEQLKTDFVSTVSHELRTPLAAIYGAAMTLRHRQGTVEGEQRDRLLDVISSESNRLARIVNDILWASRLESGRMQVEIERCDAAAIANEVAEVAQARVPEGLRLVVDAPAGLPAIAADPDKLRQVLANLLDNAVKYSPDGGTVELEASRSGGRVRFRVSDEGLGIPPAEQDRIFEKFFRLDPNLTRGVGGTGLGLYISRELVTRMSGRIWVVSDGRSGSSFFVELPIA